MTVLPLPVSSRPGQPSAIVAIPACNEAGVVENCLAALATQRDAFGAPLRAGTFEILLYANNCRDRTADVAQVFAGVCPHPLLVVSAHHDPERSNAGCARKAAMDLAADRLEAAGCHDGMILTTDADSTVAPTWFSATREAFAGSIACVAGYIDAFPAEIMRLGPRFVARSRLEDHYLRLMAEIYHLCDPRDHDPWPNHRVSSGASLAVTLAAYRAVGGLPAVALGEDGAFTRRLEAHGFAVRRPMSVAVSTSCRFDGRAKGGAADTMRLRHADADAPCDDDIEPALAVLRRALCLGALRRAYAAGCLEYPIWARRLGWTMRTWSSVLAHGAVGRPFEALWQHVELESPVLSRRRTLRPTDLPHQIDRAEAVLHRLRNGSAMRSRARPPEDAPADMSLPPGAGVPEAA